MPNLTARTIEALKPGQARVAICDDGTPGLELRVSKGGAKTFAVRYTLADGTRRRISLGRWPAMTLAKAREEALTAMRSVARGEDPAGAKKRDRHALRTAPVKTLDDLTAALFLASKGAGVRASTLDYWGWLNRKHVAPRLGDTRLSDLSAGLIRKTLREIGEATGPATGNRAFGLLRRAFNFGVEEEHLTTSPLGRMRQLFEEKSRERVLTDSELKALWTAAVATKAALVDGKPRIGVERVSRPMAISVQLCLVTCQRGGEIAGMRAGELDLQGATWVLPSARTKADREHVVPLTDVAVELIEEAAALARLRLGREPAGDDPIFPTPRLGGAERDEQGALKVSPAPIDRNAVSHAMAGLCQTAKVANATAHDLRRTGATAMASERIGVLTEVVARVLNHAPPGLGITAVYNRHAYVAEKRSALTRWADLLLEIVGERERPSNVERLRGSVAGRP